MDACLSCFGRRTQGSDSDDDQEPLLPEDNHSAEQTHCAQGGVGSNGWGPPVGQPGTAGNAASKNKPYVDFPALEKLVDIVAGLRAGKLPTQDQVTRILQVILNSELLREGLDEGARLAAYSDSTGPTSLRGVRVLRDLRGVVQAALEFSAEKNDDNKIQDFLHQLGRLDVAGVNVDLEWNTQTLPSFRPTENVKAAFNAGKDSVSDIKDQVPLLSEVSSDAAIFAHALRTLLQTVFSSAVFRCILVDAFNILRDLVAQGVVDVEVAAAHVQAVAADVEADLNDVDVNQKLDETAEGIRTATGDQVLDKGKEAVDRVLGVAQGARHQAEDKAEEWRQRGAGALNEAQNDLVARIQEMLARAQKDPASRSAMHAILILARKYSDKLAEAGDTAVEAVEQVVEEFAAASTSTHVEPTGSNEVSATASSTVPPRSALPHINVHTSNDTINDPLKFACVELKGMLERMGRGHSLDGLMKAFADVMKDLKELPVEVGETFAREVDREGRSTVATDFEGQGVEEKEGRKKAKKGKASSSGLTNSSESSAPNIIRAYFIRIGRYLDRALDRPGWVTSTKGTTALEELFMEGVEILNVVGEVAEDVGEILVGDPTEVAHLSEEGVDQTLKIRRQFRQHVQVLWAETEGFFGDIEKDRTTMKLWRSLNDLARSVSDLASSPPSSRAGTSRRPTPTSLLGRLHSSLQWTEWVGWALPRLIHLIPLSAIPIPSLEARSESGGWQAALYALFVKGQVAKSRATRGRAPLREADAVLGGIQTTLVPDQIVFKEWTEVRINMADEDPQRKPSVGPNIPARSREYPWQDAHIETTSRIRMHLDGIRARIDGLGYYFQYGHPGAWIGYEDEGILNVDIGMGQPHAGFGCDIEIEATSDSGPSRAADANPYGHQRPLGEGLEGRGNVATVPEIYIQEPGSEAVETAQGGVADLDVQGIVKRTMDREPEPDASNGTGLPPFDSDRSQRDLDPLFKVVNVEVQMKGVQVDLQKSRHWILNKLLVQPLAGPTIHQVAKVVLQDKIRDGLGTVATELAQMAKDASAHAQARRERSRRKRHEERVKKIERLIEEGYLGIDPDLFDAYGEEEDGFWDMAADWANALVERGSQLVAKDADEESREENIRVDTGVDATMQGIIIHSSTAVIDTARGEDSTPPPMVYNKDKKRMDPVQDVEGQSTEDAGVTDVSDITVAIGGGAQLFPDKQVPYGKRNDAAPSKDTLLDRAAGKAQEVTDKAKGTAKEAITVTERVEARYNEDLQLEE